MSDVILQFAGVHSDAPRDHRPSVRDAAQAAHEALFAVPTTDPVPGIDRDLRHLVAARAARLDGERAAAEWHRSRIQAIADADDLIDAGADGAVGTRSHRALRAVLRHVDLLVTRPGSAAADDLTGLRAAGWSPAEIVVIGQIVGLVSYQVRIAQALRVQEEIA